MSESTHEGHRLFALAKAILQDNGAPPVLLLAAWKCMYRGDYGPLRDLDREARA